MRGLAQEARWGGRIAPDSRPAAAAVAGRRWRRGSENLQKRAQSGRRTLLAPQLEQLARLGAGVEFDGL